MAIRRFLRGLLLEKRSSETAACFFSLLIRCNTEEAGLNDSPHSSIRSAPTDICPLVGCLYHGWGCHLIRPHACGRLSESVAANGRDHHPVAGPCIGRKI